MFVYYKNAFMLRWIVSAQPIDMLKDLMIEYLDEKWLRPGYYVFGHVEKAIKTHCR